jgi:hypothetical protein
MLHGQPTTWHASPRLAFSSLASRPLVLHGADIKSSHQPYAIPALERQALYSVSNFI